MSAEELPHLTTPSPAPGRADPVADPLGGPRQLTPVSITRDGTRLVLVDADGNEFTLAVDPSLRTALPAAPATAAPSRRSEKTSMSNPSTPTLRPRDIQARIRAGESPESVAEAAGTTVERIMPFAAPVLAEREHIAERALKASVRRRPGEPAGSARTLGQAVSTQLGTLAVDDDAVEWDSWRRTDGRWTLVALYATPVRAGTAELTFDPPGNFVSLDNDDARWLVGDLVEPEPEPVRDDLAQARVRRLTPPASAAVPDESHAAGETVAEPELRRSEDELPLDEPLEAFLPEPAAHPEVQPEAEPQQAAQQPDVAPDEKPGEAPEAGPAAKKAAQPPRRTPAKKRGRASVPSWDEIMFGGGSSD